MCVKPLSEPQRCLPPVNCEVHQILELTALTLILLASSCRDAGANALGVLDDTTYLYSSLAGAHKTGLLYLSA